MERNEMKKMNSSNNSNNGNNNSNTNTRQEVAARARELNRRRCWGVDPRGFLMPMPSLQEREDYDYRMWD